ncbi:hypothetical protein [Desulfoluna butyratoxydans]|uniref:Uncharacterized protein n=1 Tax=Desulfoluna butyratoxydans TaxID=231438 RepID=A0A4U8YHU4_9BACT|nr:hypothetical protein [Desulfoluna butyratoxydans]VFQ42764.1 hypothetical protein MSL71_3850 [Desulfoluna butyratoxydans]
MRQTVGAVWQVIKTLFTAEDSRLMKAELRCTWGGTRWDGVVKTMVWYCLAGAGVMLMARL